MNDPFYIYIAIFAVTSLSGVLIGYIIRKTIAEKQINSAENYAKRVIEDASKEAEAKKKEAVLEAKDEIFKLKSEQERENKDRRNEIQKLEKRLLQREENLDKKSDQLDKKNEQLDRQISKLEEKELDMEKLLTIRMNELEKISGLSSVEAKEILIGEIKKEVTHDIATILREKEAEIKENAEVTAREIITKTVQRYAAEHVTESVVTVVNLPNDEMKGRIIGREGRNIRAFETITGIELIIDDTPEAVVLSGFEPTRREIARITLEKLIVDGRIHPARIEEMYEKAKQEVDQTIKIEGENACDKANVRGLHPELVKYIGRLKYRTSYGQNVLTHSVEVANLAGMLAQELGADVKIAKRGGFLHDIGKAIDHEMEGTHVELGVQLAKKYKEKWEIIHCIEAHHGDVEAQTVEAIIVQAADTISAARPGARRESLENYVKRLENLEAIANSYEGIEKSYAMQAGRELRIMVKPESISEDQMVIIAHDISKRIEEELEYPGHIKIDIIRETRVTDYAK